MKRWFLRLVLFFFWCLLLVVGGLAYETHRVLTTPGSPTPEDVLIAIAPGATFDRVAWDLKKAGVITDVFRFRLLARYQDSLEKIRAGEFRVNRGWTPDQVLKQITEGRAVLYRFSVREGLTWWETARAAEEQGFALYEDFKAVIHDPEFLREHGIPFANAEGFLFPETYLMEKPRQPLDREQARIVASRMVRTFWIQATSLWTEPAAPSPPDPAASAAAVTPVSSVPSPPAPTTPVPTSPAELPAPAAPATAATPVSADSAVPAPITPASAASGESVPAAPTGPATLASSDPAASVAAAPTASPVPSQSATAAAPAAPVPAPLAPTATPVLSVPASPAPAGLPTPADSRSGASPDPAALRRLVILASLVEKETGLPVERGLVAGVYANRLHLGMLLQCDPTIIYGVGESFTGAIRRSQIDDSGNQYNTYQHPGLPPGPICSPGFGSLQAAFSPEKHDYLYFVATGLDGGHSFSRTLPEHNKAVRLYRERVQGR